MKYGFFDDLKSEYVITTSTDPISLDKLFGITGVFFINLKYSRRL